jgi:hypothetical protein
LWLQAPEIRFGYGYIISITTLLVSGVIYVLIYNQNFIKEYFLNFLLFTFFCSVFYKNFNNYKIISLDINHKFDYENFSLVSKDNNFNFYRPPSGKSCGFFPEICVNQDGNYQASIKHNYLTFIKNK